MSVTRKILLGILTAIFVAGFGSWLYMHYRNIKGPHVPALEAIYPGVVMFAQFDDARAAFYKLTNETDYWPALISDSLFERFQDQLSLLDSLTTSSGWLNEMIELQKLTVSLNKNPAGNYQFIFLLDLPPGDHQEAFEQFIRSAGGEQSLVMKRDFEKAVIHTVNLTEAEKLFYYSVYKGLFIGSFDVTLVEATIGQLNGKWSLAEEEAFSRIYRTAGKNVEANIFIHLPNFFDFTEKHVSQQYSSLVGDLRNLGTWTEIDMLINSEDLLFNGYTIANDTALGILDRFRQPAQPIRVTEILPAEVTWMLHWGISDIKDFLLNGLTRKGITSLFSSYEKEFGIDLEREFISWIGHEITLAAVPPQSGKQRPVVAIHTEDVVRAALSLGEMEKKVNRKNRTQPYLRTYNDYNIRRLGLNRIFNDLFGEPFPVMGDCYYVTLKDYVVFSGDEKDLVQLIDAFYGKKTLQTDPNYITFSDNISDRSNIYLYCNLRNAGPVLSGILEGSPVEKSLLNGIARFEGIALQFSYINDMFYTNMFLSYNQEYHPALSSNWTAELKGEVAGSPFLIKNHRNGKTNVLVFDRDNNMYLLDQMGRKQWQLSLVEAPMGEVHMVDYYRNGKFQYLFNTENYVYLVDLNGNYVADYPKKMVAPATGPLALLDYDGNGDLRLLIGLADNKIHNFDLKMAAVEGWEKVHAKAAVREPAQYLRNRGKDYLFFTDEQGAVKITDRRGKDRIVPHSLIAKAKHSSFYINRTNSKGIFLTTDRSGKVVYLDEKGNVNRTDFGEFDGDHYFFYEDFDGDDHMDFIFVNRNRIVVYDRLKNIIMQEQFPEVITQQPVLFTWAGRKYLGVILDAAAEIQIFDHQGRRFRDLYLEGTVPFVAGSLEQGKLNLITGKGNQVFNFQLN